MSAICPCFANANLGILFAPGAGEQEVRAPHNLQRIHRIFMKFHRIPVPLEVCPHWFLHRYWCLCEEREGTKRRADLNGGIRSFRMPGAIEMMMDDGWSRCFSTGWIPGKFPPPCHHMIQKQLAFASCTPPMSRPSVRMRQCVVSFNPYPCLLR